ncbi:hypothetical protein HYW20_01515 [Candidatus Woesearchaeota archaeon]|nr:hypothetical protein [Candidatus Woesearchaeota archaeon]
MRKIKKEMIAILLILLALALSQNTTADVLGCCSNPGAGMLACSEDTLVLRDSGCCPQPQSTYTEYYQSQTNPFGPLNYNVCVSNFFVANQGCAGVSACALGCCCSQAGGQVKPEAQCKGTGVTFFNGQTDCDQACPTPQCSDGINNDPANNNCADFPVDLGCDSPSDTTESGGSCTTQTLKCNDISYVPKLSNLQITPTQGQKSFSLIWLDECTGTAAYYDILRCAGNGCTNFAAAGVSNTNSFIDTSQDLAFDTVYTYKAVAHYNVQTATPSIVKTATLGSSECSGKQASAVFCLNNKAYYCDVSNSLIQQGTSCTSAQACVVDNNIPKCLTKSNCNPTDDNPFGMFYTLASCENGRYCFYDRSYTTVNSCYSCVASMACYDYKSEESCTRDNCRAGNCKWKAMTSQLGTGFCVSTQTSNCKWCDSKGTPLLENLRSFNEVFDFCTQEKSDALSEGSLKCYYKSGKSIKCGDAVCTDYNPGQCSNVQIRHDENNQITNPSPDSCGIKVCQNINSQCVKNADGDNTADCLGDAICEKDLFAPNTTMLPVIRNGITANLLLQIYDRTSASSPSALKNYPEFKNYAAFLCVEPCGLGGHPYDNFTAGRNLVVSNLKVFDGVTGSKLLTMKEGQNVIRYYSRDPSKNIEEVKKLTIAAFSNTDGPRIFSVNISGGSVIHGKIFTNNPKPTINVQFFEPAAVAFLKLTNKKTNSVVNIQGSTSLSATAGLIVGQNLQDGEYALDLDAKNEKGISMKPPYTTIIVIDSTKPNMTIEPANNAVLSASLANIKLTFSEEIDVNSLSVKLSSAESKGNFTTADNKVFAAKMNLSDGNKNLDVVAGDLAKNQVSGSIFFIVDALPTTITLIRPKFGAASSYVFDIVLETDNDATCKHSMDNLEYQFMDAFQTSGGTLHTINSFNKIKPGDTSIRKLYVKCSDTRRGIASKSFDLSVDATPPQLIGAFAVPNPVVEKPSVTTLKIESDEQVICRFSATSPNFDAMEGKFNGFDSSTFKTINAQNITLESEGDYTYHVACQNKAELVSNTQDIQITVDLSMPIIITSHTPEFFNSTSVILAIDTNKLSQCKYSETDTTVVSGSVFGAPGYSHTAKLISSQGRHTFYVSCKDQYLGDFSDVNQITFTVDTTPPIMLFVEELGTLPAYPQISCFKDKLKVKWLGQDEDSGIKHYFYSMLRGSNQVILNWTRSTFFSDPQNQNEWSWIENLNLQDNVNYFFKVQAVNVVNLVSPPKNSDGITVNVSRCNPDARCGDGRIDPGEQCDGTTFGLINRCLQYTNFIGGTLKCTNDCAIDTSGCESLPKCGNSFIDKGETCDGTTFGQIKACTDYNGTFISGSLKCTTTCQLDTNACTESPKCGNSFIDKGETCDGSNFGPLNGNCANYNPSTFTGGTLGCKQCQLDTSKCQGVQGTCGDGILNIGESCDGTSLGTIKTCTAYGSSFTGGDLKCTSTCQLDTNACTESPKCGNSIIDQGESCDKANLGPLSGNCIDYSQFFKSGKLGCGQNCRIDTNACTESPKCGNSLLDTGEICDGTNFGNITDLSCSSYSSNFISGSVICKSCRIATDDCKSNLTSLLGCKDRGDCKLNDQCTDSSECASRYCFNGKCTGATCDDSIRNQGESDIDCSGPCDKCNNGKICSIDSDCQSNFCSFGTCKEADECHDRRFSGHETDIDCGGPCPAKCSEGMGCGTNEDCGENLKCISSICKQCASGDENCDGASDAAKDSDGDGMADDWEIQNGLNPDDPNDADIDSDKDGLTNIEEFRQRTDPNAADTDNDGFTDKREVDAGTDPLDSESFPKSSFVKTLLFVIGIIVLLSGLGYATYRIVAKKKEEELKSLKSAGMQRDMTRMIHQQPSRQVGLRPRIDQLRLREALKRRGELKEKERKKMFESFGGKSVQGQPPKTEEPKQKEETKPKEDTKLENAQKTEQLKPKEEEKHKESEAKKKSKETNPKKHKESEAKKKSKETNPKKHKEDVFAKLKKISKEGKKFKKKI